MEGIVRKIVIGAHCIANPSFITILEPTSPNQIVRSPSMYIKLLEYLNEKKVGFFQLPCPEAIFMGISKGYQPKEFFENNPEFIKLCQELCDNLCNQLKKVMELSEENGIKLDVVALIGIDGSPSCACERTRRVMDGKKKYTNEPGVFMEILKDKLKQIGIDIPMIDITKKSKLSAEKFEKLEKLVEGEYSSH